MKKINWPTAFLGSALIFAGCFAYFIHHNCDHLSSFDWLILNQKRLVSLNSRCIRVRRFTIGKTPRRGIASRYEHE